MEFILTQIGGGWNCKPTERTRACEHDGVDYTGVTGFGKSAELAIADCKRQAKRRHANAIRAAQMNYRLGRMVSAAKRCQRTGM